MSNYASARASITADLRAFRRAIAKAMWDSFVSQPGVKQWMADEIAANFDRGTEIVLPERAPERRTT